MRLRRVLMTGAAMVLATSATATGAPKYCNILSDQSGDAASYVDIISGDIATGKTELVAVLRLGRGTEPTETLSILDWYDWTFAATLSGVDYTFSRSEGWGVANAPPTTSVRVGNTSPPYTFQVVGNTFVWKIKRKDLPSLNKKPGQRFTEIHATTSLGGSTDDTAVAAGKSYPDKAPSCVKAN